MLLLPHVAEPDFSSDLNSLGAFPGGYGYGGEMLLRVQRKGETNDSFSYNII